VVPNHQKQVTLKRIASFSTPVEFRIAPHPARGMSASSVGERNRGVRSRSRQKPMPWKRQDQVLGASADVHREVAGRALYAPRKRSSPGSSPFGCRCCAHTIPNVTGTTGRRRGEIRDHRRHAEHRKGALSVSPVDDRAAPVPRRGRMRIDRCRPSRPEPLLPLPATPPVPGTGTPPPPPDSPA